MHHTFPLKNVGWDTCTAALIYSPTHEYLENTLPSMQAAFRHGATLIELDVRASRDGHLMVFHDFSLDCRTDGSGLVRDASLEYLKSLDIGYGYTPDSGATYPLRGTGVGLMPTLAEVLAAFHDGRFIIHDKDGDDESIRLLIETLREFPSEQRANLYYWGRGEQFKKLHQEIPEVAKFFFMPEDVRACRAEYARMLLAGTLSAECQQHVIAIPMKYLRIGFGWHRLVLFRAHQAGVRVVVTEVDTPAELDKVRALPFNGIMTNRIGIIGPLMENE